MGNTPKLVLIYQMSDAAGQDDKSAASIVTKTYAKKTLKA
jgi:hypothetical protein